MQPNPSPNELYTNIMYLLRLGSHSHKASKPVTIALVGAGGKTHLAFYLADLFKQKGLKVGVTTTTKMYLPSIGQVDSLHEFDPKAELPCFRLLTAPPEPEQTLSIQFFYQCRLPSKDGKTKVQGFTTQEFGLLYGRVPIDVWIIEADGANRLPIKAPALHEPCVPTQADLVFGVIGAEALLNPANPEQIHRWTEFSALTGCEAHDEIGATAIKRLIESPNGLFKGAPEQAARVWVINKLDMANDATAIAQLAEQVYKETACLNGILLTQLNGETPIRQLFIHAQRHSL
jgi:probable selenium-dependent hydroxylase accessory protein YqeC